MNWIEAQDIREKIEGLVSSLSLAHVKPERVFCFRSFGAKTRARARVWSLPRIWQQALKTTPAYCLEVISERFDRLPEEEKTKILIHELLHFPKNFSGSLLPHRGYKRRIDNRAVDRLYQMLKNG